MTSKNITLTSKNQITLPAEYVRKLHLGKNRQLSITQRGSELIIKPEPSLEARMQKIWSKLPPFKGTKTDDELKQVIRDAYAQKNI